MRKLLARLCIVLLGATATVCLPFCFVLMAANAWAAGHPLREAWEEFRAFTGELFVEFATILREPFGRGEDSGA